jgi:hypothetical protein
VQESDFNDDFAMNHVICNLQAMGEELLDDGGMLILSQLSFGDFLSESAYAAAVKQLQQRSLPLPSDLDTVLTKYSDGEADLILFHRYYGILIGELKPLGRWHSANNTQPPDSSVKDKVTKAVTKLNKSVHVICYVIGDVAPGLLVRATLFLPYITIAQLTRVLAADPALLQVSWVRLVLCPDISVTLLVCNVSCQIDSNECNEEACNLMKQPQLD